MYNVKSPNHWSSICYVYSFTFRYKLHRKRQDSLYKYFLESADNMLKIELLTCKMYAEMFAVIVAVNVQNMKSFAVTTIENLHNMKPVQNCAELHRFHIYFISMCGKCMFLFHIYPFKSNEMSHSYQLDISINVWRA